MTYAEIIAAWNSQADEFNQWDELCEEEKVEWARRCALEEAAKVCMDKAMQMEQKAQEDDCEADEATALRSTAWIVSNCAVVIRAMKDKP